jgi:8-oxo-dGTP diphosphatase
MTWTATNSEGYPAPVALATDIVVLTAREGALCVLTIAGPDGCRALPGGFVGAGEDPAQTAGRKLREKTGVTDIHLEQLATFADPARDPRGWIVSIAHLALVPPETEPADPGATWAPAAEHAEWAFDHALILAAALERLAGKLWWSNVAVGILPGAFTMTEARHVYEAIAGRTYDPATFARDLKATGLVAPIGERRADGPGRPAALYRFADARPRWGAGRRKRVT